MNDRETVYERIKHHIVRETIDHAEQRAIKEAQLRLTFVGHANMTREQCDRAVTAMEHQGVIVRADGWVTVDADDADWYRQVIVWCADREDPPRGLIGACNRRLSPE